jgi:protein TonB
MFGVIVFFLAEALAPKPIGDPGAWITTDDYPAEALAKDVSGTTLVELVIDDTGRVTQCRTGESSGSVELDATACALIKARGRFTPGKDANGNTVESLYRQRVAWIMPKDAVLAIPPKPDVLAVAVDVNEAGIIEACEVLEGKNLVGPGMLNPCLRYAVGAKIRRAANADGKIVPYRIITRQSTTVTPR